MGTEQTTTIRITDRKTAEQFLGDLRAAVRNSKRTGGRYAAFVTDMQGRAAVEVAIHLNT